MNGEREILGFRVPGDGAGREQVRLLLEAEIQVVRYASIRRFLVALLALSGLAAPLVILGNEPRDAAPLRIAASAWVVLAVAACAVWMLERVWARRRAAVADALSREGG